MLKNLALGTVAAVGLSWPAIAYTAPKPKEAGPSEKELKEFATKVAAALIKSDANAFVGLCDVPFHQPGGYSSKDEDDLKNWIAKAMSNGRYREGVNEVKRIEVFAKAKARFTASQAKRVGQILRDDDFVAFVEMEQIGRNRKDEMALLIKAKAGKPRLVGLEVVR